MVILERTDRCTLHLRFDLAGAEALRQLCVEVRGGRAATIAITLDRRVVTHRRQRHELSAELTLALLPEDDEPSLHQVGKTVRLNVPVDILEQWTATLEECACRDVYWPSEWIAVREGDTARSSDIYCILAI